MAVFVFELVSEPEISKIATISSPFKWRNRMSKFYCVECPFPGGGNSSDNSPWIAVLLQAFHNIIGYAVATTPLYAQRQQQASHQNSEASFETQNSSVVPIWQAFL